MNYVIPFIFLLLQLFCRQHSVHGGQFATPSADSCEVPKCTFSAPSDYLPHPVGYEYWWMSGVVHNADKSRSLGFLHGINVRSHHCGLDGGEIDTAFNVLYWLVDTASPAHPLHQSVTWDVTDTDTHLKINPNTNFINFQLGTSTMLQLASNNYTNSNNHHHDIDFHHRHHQHHHYDNDEEETKQKALSTRDKRHRQHKQHKQHHDRRDLDEVSSTISSASASSLVLEFPLYNRTSTIPFSSVFPITETDGFGCFNVFGFANSFHMKLFPEIQLTVGDEKFSGIGLWEHTWTNVVNALKDQSWHYIYAALQNGYFIRLMNLPGFGEIQTLIVTHADGTSDHVTQLNAKSCITPLRDYVSPVTNHTYHPANSIDLTIGGHRFQYTVTAIVDNNEILTNFDTVVYAYEGPSLVTGTMDGTTKVDGTGIIEMHVSEKGGLN